MISVGLTGSVASGKSSLAGFWREAGVPVVSADDLARQVVEPGTEGLRQVVEAFGDGVLSADGTLDRAALRERVFRSGADRGRLEAILHPLIAERRAEWIAARRSEGAPIVAAEIPLLFEVGLEGEFDRVVVVDAPRDERLRRLVEDRGLEPEEAGRIMGSQMDPGRKRARADHVLLNDGSLEELRVASLELLEGLRERTGMPEQPEQPEQSEASRGSGGTDPSAPPPGGPS